MHQCDNEKYDHFESEHSASLDSKSSDSNESPLLCTSWPPLFSSSLSSSPLSSTGPGAGRCLGRAGRVLRGVVLHGRTSSWCGGSVGVGYLHLEEDGWLICFSIFSTSRTGLSHGATLVVAVMTWHDSRLRLSPHRESCRRVTRLFATWS